MRHVLICLSFLLIASSSHAFAPKLKQRYDSETAINQEFRNIYDNLDEIRSPSPHAQISDTTTQTIADISLAQVITFNKNNHIYKIGHSTGANTSKIYVLESGSYFISFSAQLSLTSGASEKMEIWLRVNGIDVPNSNTKSHITNINDERILTVTLLKELNENDYIELAMSGTSTGCELFAADAGTSPTRPAIPSIILTIDRLVD